MKRILNTIMLGLGASVLTWAGLSFADEESHSQDFQLKNRIRFEYDDNIYESAAHKHGSFKIDEEIELIYNMNFEQSYVGLRYRPSFVWWADRPSDSTDLHHDFDLDLSHNFTPRLTLSAKETFLYAQQPQLMDRGVTIAENDNYIYNRANADISYLLRPETKLELGGRYTLLRYDNSKVSKLEDYDIYAGGATLRHQVSADTALSGEARVESITYAGPNRDSSSEYIGGGLEHTFNPAFLGNIRAGLQHKDFSAAHLSAKNQPYVDGALTYLPSPRTRLTAGAGYSMFESDVYPYANQDRTLIYASVAHDLTAKVSLFLTGSYQDSSYSGDQSIDKTLKNKDGSEEIVQISASATYKINRNNWLEAGYQYLSLNSDVRNDFDRNRVSVGWRTTL